MKNFYARLAATGIKNNRKLYIPYILAGSGMTAMVYIIAFLMSSQTVQKMGGGRTISAILGFGIWIMIIFSAIFLFYTNSFLIRRRKREFGLYNILGMGKKNINRIMLNEAVMIYFLTQLIGLTLGVALSKLSELGLIHIVHSTVTYSVVVSTQSLILTSIAFAFIHFLIYLNSLRQLSFSSPLDLVKSENIGERPPKTNPLFALAGIAIMAGAYYIAVTIDDPFKAMALFFLAVIMVIIATYLLFISGSVALCKVLQKSKRFYYKPSHFISVSSMSYRMKRNGAGLATICILASMILVTVSSTTSLYLGIEDNIAMRHEYDIEVMVRLYEGAGFEDKVLRELSDKFTDDLNERGLKPKRLKNSAYVTISGYLENGILTVNGPRGANGSICFYPLDYYNKETGKAETLRPGEALIFTDGGEYDIGNQLTFVFDDQSASISVKDITEPIGNSEHSIYVIIRNDEEALKKVLSFRYDDGEQVASTSWDFCFDADVPDSQAKAITDSFRGIIANQRNDDTLYARSYSVRSAALDKSDIYATYGGLFFLGIILSLAFCIAAVLIMHYKQISEGYEDQSRFDIMQKVGMSKRDIRKSVNFQVRTIFYLPLVTAGCHMFFAFNMVKLMLQALDLNNTALFTYTFIGSFALFAVFYTVTYKITANSYYSIVSRQKE